MGDKDRMFIEFDLYGEDVVGAFDLKWANSGDTITATEKGIYDWHIKHDCPVYIVYISRDFSSFRVFKYRAGEIGRFTELAYADWLLSLREAN